MNRNSRTTGLYNGTGTEHKRHKRDTKGTRNWLPAGAFMCFLCSFLCLLCSFPLRCDGSSSFLAAQPRTVEVNLDARISRVTIEPGHEVDAWTYNGDIPGPLIRARVGDRLIVHLTNHLPQPTTGQRFEHVLIQQGAAPSVKAARRREKGRGAGRQRNRDWGKESSIGPRSFSAPRSTDSEAVPTMSVRWRHGRSSSSRGLRSAP